MKNIYIRLLTILTAFLLGFSLSGSAKPKKMPLWMFGFSASFTDSIVYISDVQKVEPAYIETSTGFLYDRSIYSLQVENFIEEQLGKPRTTCTIFFSKSRKKMEKKFFSIRKRYIKEDGLAVKTLEGFSFVPVDWTEHDVITIETPQQQ